MAETPTTSPATTSPSATPSAQRELREIYAIPNRLQYIAGSSNIDDTSEPMRVGQINVFFKATLRKDSVDKEIWIGITTGQIFSARWKGIRSTPILDEDPSVLKGSKAYEVIVKQPVQDYTTNRTEVMPTGRVAGEVVSAGAGNGHVYVLMEDWFVDSDNFKTGQWVDVNMAMLVMH